MTPDVWGGPFHHHEIRRHLAAAIVVALIIVVGALALGRPSGQVAARADDAVLVDLPASVASGPKAADSKEGPPQEASAAVAAPPKVVPDTPPAPEPPLPPASADGTLEVSKPKPTPPAVDPSAAQEAQAPAGSDSSTDIASETKEAARAARAISLWQRAMVSRIEAARHKTARHALAGGTVEIAFAIDRTGRLVSRRIDRSSGIPALDAIALRLLDSASPFPAPPAGVGEGDLSFTVPIRFQSRR